MFIPSEEFWAKSYHKFDPVTFDWPNVNENMQIEFGKMVRGSWTPCIPAEATHVGLYFWDYRFSYLVNNDDEVRDYIKEINQFDLKTLAPSEIILR